MGVVIKDNPKLANFVLKLLLHIICFIRDFFKFIQADAHRYEFFFRDVRPVIYRLVKRCKTYIIVNHKGELVYVHYMFNFL